MSEFWRRVAHESLTALQSRAPGRKLWLSTAGQGVEWLHFRIEDTPKYYSYQEYKRGAVTAAAAGYSAASFAGSAVAMGASSAAASTMQNVSTVVPIVIDKWGRPQMKE